MNDNQIIPSGYTLYRRTMNGILSDVVAHLSATDDNTAWREVAKLNGAKPTSGILRSLKTAYQIMPVYEETRPFSEMPDV
ncbi:hypothetical protein [Acetobacter peroxydans]|uniref:Uncharacterized protein n=1 Tax=Acetobacter peroxydans TaxID=104098 RepID=A0A4Y3TXL9_9PROT|nr:hypothetical protein [Acetobacter peroxydans]NHO17062.1 hypothetical protein [Acetobacter peroxydans]GBR36661.1 hypothetical protein AA13755_1591 [Acetobacter peroxydans NBRC 13755]GBR39549.1 hypothetical protein AA0475_0240 [Acetobacter peroxydans]GEB86572.1 hypothetical protein APE01nite_23690 [Acetobacter peroxydans]